ncbi:MAG: hypothetical protein JWO09_563 [Bacteroidetes bacterium]|nr:hypothetical protein [Bacteroidota bacterium]
MQLTKTAWWTNKRLHLNKGLLVAGLLAILFTCVLFYVLDRSVMLGVMIFPIGVVILLIYISVMNFVFVLLEAIDRQFIKSADTGRREILFRCLFWLAMILPFLYPVFILYAINSGSE